MNAVRAAFESAVNELEAAVATHAVRQCPECRTSVAAMPIEKIVTHRTSTAYTAY